MEKESESLKERDTNTNINQDNINNKNINLNQYNNFNNRNANKRLLSSKIFSVIIALAVITLLVLSGPAEAFVLELTIPNSSLFKGDKISFTASVKINSNEILNISHFVLKLTGSGSNIVNCEFKVDGTIISGCTGISIVRISSADYGYGYGYNYGYNSGYDYGHGYGYGYGYGFNNGILKYNITLNTSGYSIGVYKTSIGFLIGENEFEQAGGDLTIKTKPGPISGGNRKNCDFAEGESVLGKIVRGENGILFVEQGVFGNIPRGTNKLNINIPSKITKTGKGSITSIRNGEKFTYDFKITKIVEDNTFAYFYAEGYYKVGKVKKTKLNVVFTLDKRTSILSFSSDKVSLESILVVYGGKDCKLTK